MRNGSGYPPACTVIVCTRGRHAALTLCLRSLAAQTFRDFEVLVVDSAPPDTRNLEIATTFGARHVIEPLPGAARARNTGMRHCHTSLIAFLDDDCVAEPGWLHALLREFTSPDVMAVTGNILMPLPEFGPTRLVLNQSHPAWFEIANFGGIGSGGNMAFRRSVLARWPGFDERLGRGVTLPACEENYAFYAVIAGGGTIVYTPASVVRHPHKTGAAALRADFRNVACAIAYFTLLLVETRHRSHVARYCLQALAGTPRAWRPPGNGTPPGRRWWTPLAVLAGPFLYALAALRPVTVASPVRALAVSQGLRAGD